MVNSPHEGKKNSCCAPGVKRGNLYCTSGVRSGD